MPQAAKSHTTSRRGLFGGVAAAGIASAALPAIAAATSDAELVALGRAFCQIVSQERQLWEVAERTHKLADADAANTQAIRAGRIAFQIGQHQATTMGGIVVKMAVLDWCLVHPDQTMEEGLDEMLGIIPGRTPSTDVSFARAILRDLHSMRAV